ncbi:MAG TPA: FN3 domain-containing metallophosphoesterase family protein [Daejeonella sp.]
MKDVNKKTMARRNFLAHVSKAGLLTTVAGLLPGVSSAKSLLPSEKITNEVAGFLARPYLQMIGPHGINISWITGKLSFSWIEYGEGSNLDKKAYHDENGFIDAYNRVNSVPLRNLKPETTYSYRIVSKEITDFKPYALKYGEIINTETFSFTTPKENPTNASWLVLNDIHDRPESISHLMKLNGADDYDYVFFNGDIFDYQTDEKQIIDHFLTPSTEAFATVKPFLFVRGNHETRGKFARDLKNYIGVRGEKGYYAYSQGPVFTIVIDTGEDKPDEHPVYAGIVKFDEYREEQAVWLEGVMKSDAYKKAKFRVVMMHIPPFHSGDWHGPMHCRKLYAPLFEKYKIDMVISGHTHKYGIHPPDHEHSYPVIIGGGPKDGNRTLIKVKADTKTLNMTMLKDDGTEIGQFQLKTKK